MMESWATIQSWKAQRSSAGDLFSAETIILEAEMLGKLRSVGFNREAKPTTGFGMIDAFT